MEGTELQQFRRDVIGLREDLAKYLKDEDAPSDWGAFECSKRTLLLPNEVKAPGAAGQGDIEMAEPMVRGLMFDGTCGGGLRGTRALRGADVDPPGKLHFAWQGKVLGRPAGGGSLRIRPGSACAGYAREGRGSVGEVLALRGPAGGKSS